MNLPTTPTDKPATINTRSDAASANEVATAVAGATVSEKPKSDTVPGGSILAATVPAWKAACKVEPSYAINRFGWHRIVSPKRIYWWYSVHGEWVVLNPHSHIDGCVYTNSADAAAALAACTVPPPDWPTPAHTDDPREEPERFCEATGPVAEQTSTVPDWKKACSISTVGGGAFYTVLSPRGGWSLSPNNTWKPVQRSGVVHVGYGTFCLAKDALDACTICPPDWTETVTYSDPSPCGTFVRKITKPVQTVTYEPGQAKVTSTLKFCESIEQMIDRLAHIRDCHKIDWQFQIRVTGDVEKAEPRSYDSPGYPEHFALHHVYLGEDLTRAILTTIAYDLDSKGVDKPTVRKVLESVARAFQLTAEFGETDLIGMAVAVEDKLDIGKE